MKGTKYLFLAATALSFAACSSDDENMGANDGRRKSPQASTTC